MYTVQGLGCILSQASMEAENALGKPFVDSSVKVGFWGIVSAPCFLCRARWGPL